MSLHSLSPEPSPTGVFEAVAIGGISKTAFHQMSSPSAVLPCRRTGRLCA
jgi:hypothetical protein